MLQGKEWREGEGEDKEEEGTSSPQEGGKEWGKEEGKEGKEGRCMKQQKSSESDISSDSKL